MEVRKRIYLAGLFHETNTFVEASTPKADFRISRGDEILTALGNGSVTDGFLQSAQDYGWQVVPGVHYHASPSGPSDHLVFEEFWADLCGTLIPSLAKGLDAVFLILHGAMVSSACTDVEGELLHRIRHLPKAQSIPVFAVLDLHANVSERMARHASALIPYRKNPHTDARETAIRAARLLDRSLTSGRVPKVFYRHSRILLTPPQTGTDESPMRELEALARTLETSARHWEAGIAAGFAHADTEDAGLSFWVVSDQPESVCEESLEALFQEARRSARIAALPEWELAEALDRITAERKFPALLVEPSDNIGGGAPGDMTSILRALLEHPSLRCGVIINDPEAVRALSGLSPGQPARISLGGKGSRLDPGPVPLEVELERLTTGRFELEDRQSHLAAAGCIVNMGPSAVVSHGHLTILITSRKTPPFDLGQWRSQGVEPTRLDVLSVKAAVGHRRAYDPITASTFTVRTPGPCSNDLGALPFRKLRRPIYPLDP